MNIKEYVASEPVPAGAAVVLLPDGTVKAYTEEIAPGKRVIAMPDGMILP